MAIKVIRAELANRPEFIRRFEVEAHLVARLEHPHIVPLYDYWREPGSAVPRDAAAPRRHARAADRRQPLDVRRSGPSREHVGAALSAAHRAGIVHRDVKPANVFLDGEGNYFLGDFGIAYEAAAPQHATDSLSVGSPAYASPEQLRREPVGPPADVHGLAITLFEALTGRCRSRRRARRPSCCDVSCNDPLPPVDAVRPDLPPARRRGARTKATAKDPAERYATVDEFVDAFTARVRARRRRRRVGAATVVGELRNPYKGLRAFQEADAADFHGRQRLVDRARRELAGPHAHGALLHGRRAVRLGQVVRRPRRTPAGDPGRRARRLVSAGSSPRWCRVPIRSRSSSRR